MLGLGDHRKIRRDRQSRRLCQSRSHAARPRYHGGLWSAEEREREGTRLNPHGGDALGRARPDASVTLRARRITFFVGFLTLLLLTLRPPRPSDLSELFTVLRMTIGVTDPTRMIFVKDIHDARKACDCRQNCHAVIERSPSVEIARLTAVRSSGGQCELISYRVTKADADAADRNGIRGAAFALFGMKSQDIIRRYAPATFLHDSDAER